MSGVGRDAVAGLVDPGVRLGVEGLVADVVPARVLVQVDVAAVAHPLPQFLRRPLVVLVGGADEAFEAGPEAFLQGLESVGVPLGQFRSGDALRSGGLLHLLPVDVGTGQEPDVEAVEPLEPRECVGGDVLVGVPDVRSAVGVGDRGGDVVRASAAVGRAGRIRAGQIGCHSAQQTTDRARPDPIPVRPIRSVHTHPFSVNPRPGVDVGSPKWGGFAAHGTWRSVHRPLVQNHDRCPGDHVVGIMDVHL